eukprot:9503766-Pyramimonas_sp.AAC.4
MEARRRRQPMPRQPMLKRGRRRRRGATRPPRPRSSLTGAPTPTGSVAFTSYEVGNVMTSFSFLLNPFFVELQRSAAGAFDGENGLAGSADCTWKVQWQGYVVGALYLHLYRCIKGGWRNTPLPVCICVRPREGASVCKKTIQAVRSELHRRRLPRLRQLGLDHFSGLEQVFLGGGKCAQGGKVSHGIGHLCKNLRKNQTARRWRRRPRLDRRDINAACVYVHESSALPTRAQFSLLWREQEKRIVHVWMAPRWVSYFKRVYLRSHALPTERWRQ